mgnify:CR=1 FL=1
MPDCEKSLDWIRVERILSPSDKKMYQAKLHDGEVEVMILAQEGVRADLVILDDNAAKKTAKYLGLTVTGTFGKSRNAAANSSSGITIDPSAVNATIITTIGLTRFALTAA